MIPYTKSKHARVGMIMVFLFTRLKKDLFEESVDSVGRGVDDLATVCV